MTLSLDPHGLIAFLLALVRAGAWVVVSPVFSSVPTPMMVKVGIASSLSLLAIPQIPTSQLPVTVPQFIGSILVQVLIGGGMGMVARIMMSVFESAGTFADMFGGIILPPALDPLTQNQVPQIGSLFQLVAVTLLFVSNGALFMVRGFVTSFQAVGLTMASFGTFKQVLSRDISTFMVAALEIAGPLLVILFTAQVVLGLIAKAAPQANIFLLGFSFQVLLALFLLTVGLKSMPPYVTNAIERAITDGLHLVGL